MNPLSWDNNEGKNRMKDSLAKHITTFNCTNKLFPFPLLARYRYHHWRSYGSDFRCLLRSCYVAHWYVAVSSKGLGVDRRRERRRGEVQLTFSGCTAYPYRVCHCFTILPAFFWHMNNIIITPLHWHLSPGTIYDQYITIYASAFRDY